jgi:hypothetical protein
MAVQFYVHFKSVMNYLSSTFFNNGDSRPTCKRQAHVKVPRTKLQLKND